MTSTRYALCISCLLPFLQAITTSQKLGQREPGNLIPPGIWTLADVMDYGRQQGTCPYFTVRRMVSSIFIHSRCPICVCLDKVEEDVPIVTFRRHRDLLLSLSAGPESRGAGVKGDVEGFDSRL